MCFLYHSTKIQLPWDNCFHQQLGQFWSFCWPRFVVQNVHPRAPAAHRQKKKPNQTCFAFILVKSVLAQSESGNETKRLKCQQQPRIWHSAGLDYSAANAWPDTSSSLLVSLYCFSTTTAIECQVMSSGGEWKAYFSHLFESRITFSVEECIIQATK